MNILRTLGILCMLGVATLLAGCNLTAETRLSDSEQFKAICRNEATGYLLWSVLITQVKVDQSIKDTVSKAHSIVRTNCANPPTDIASALIAMADAFRIIQSTTGDIQVAAARSAVAQAN